MENLVAKAAQGHPTSLIHLMRFMIPALEEREKAHPRNESESPDPARQVSYKIVRVQMNYAKGKY